MREYGRVYSKFWTSPDMQSLSDDGRVLALYLLSGPHGTIVGAFRLPDGYIVEDLRRWTPSRVSKGFKELSANGFAYRCETTKWVWVRKYLLWNRPENPNQWKAARKVVDQVPVACQWKADFLRVLAAFEAGDDPFGGDPPGTVGERLGKPFRNQDQEQEQEREGSGTASPPRPRASKRAPPEFVPDREYALREIPDLDVEREVQKFRDCEFKRPHSDWPATWRTWISNARSEGRYARIVSLKAVDPYAAAV